MNVACLIFLINQLPGVFCSYIPRREFAFNDVSIISAMRAFFQSALYLMIALHSKCTDLLKYYV